jgi:hypothetical protein
MKARGALDDDQAPASGSDAEVQTNDQQRGRAVEEGQVAQIEHDHA